MKEEETKRTETDWVSIGRSSPLYPAAKLTGGEVWFSQKNPHNSSRNKDEKKSYFVVGSVAR